MAGTDPLNLDPPTEEDLAVALKAWREGRPFSHDDSRSKRSMNRRLPSRRSADQSVGPNAVIGPRRSNVWKNGCPALANDARKAAVLFGRPLTSERVTKSICPSGALGINTS